MTLTFLLAYIFYNDGIQTVIYSASIYGSEELGFGTSVLITTILLIQFVAFGGALYFGRLAARYGAYKSILWGTFAWMGIVVVAMFLPEKNLPLFLAVGIAIGVVLGGTQALSRSFFSLLIPRGKEGSTSLCTTPSSAERRGSASCCSAWSSRSPAPTGRPSSR